MTDLCWICEERPGDRLVAVEGQVRPMCDTCWERADVDDDSLTDEEVWG